MDARRKAHRFDILVSPAWRPMLRVIGVKPEDAFVELTTEDLHVKFGVFEQTFPLKAVEAARVTEWPLWAGIGPRYVPGTVGLVGTYLNTVVVDFKEQQRWRMGRLPLPFHRLYLSMKDPDAFVAAFAAPTAEVKAA